MTPDTANSDKTYERGATLRSACDCCEHAADEIERLRQRLDELEFVAKTLKDAEEIEANETLAGYCHIFSELLAKGKGPVGANAYAIARATCKDQTEIARLQSLLAGRDEFIVSRGLWLEFCGQLHDKPAGD